MLVISRRKGQRITIGEDVEITVTSLHKSSVKLGISAPRGYTVLRGEVRDSIEAANRDAAATALDATPRPAGSATTQVSFILRARNHDRQHADEVRSQSQDAAATTDNPEPASPANTNGTSLLPRAESKTR